MGAPLTASPQVFMFRDAARELSPWWLRRGIALRLLYVFGLFCDFIASMAVVAVRRRFPGLDTGLFSDDALYLIGRDRRILRGIAESAATYATRLRRWLDDHRFRGGPYAMLEQLRAFYAHAPFKIELIYASGRRFTLNTDGTITRDDLMWTPPFDAAAGYTRWGRWWLFYHWPDPVDDDGIWSDPGTWDDGGIWDTGYNPEQIRIFRSVPDDWHAAHALGNLIFLSPGKTIADYQPSVGAGVYAVIGLNSQFHGQ